MNLGGAFYDSLINPFFRKRRRRKLELSTAFSWLEALKPQPQIKNEHLQRTKLPWTFLPFFLALYFVFGLFFTRLFELQVVKGAENAELAEQNRVRRLVIRPPRGIIYDRTGKVLAGNIPGFRVVVENVKCQMSNVKWAGELAKILDMTAEEIQTRIEEGCQEGLPLITLKEGVAQEVVLKIEANAERFPGVKTEISPLRNYVDPELYAHLLGFTGEISRVELEVLKGHSLGSKVGKSGIEKSYEEFLRGEDGERLVELDALGEKSRDLYEKPAQVGYDLVLSIDDSLQKIAFAALKEGIKKAGATGGAVVAQRVESGEILALVSLPSFDSNSFSQGLLKATDYQNLLLDPAKPLFNRAIQGEYAPGSTFKLVTATAALEEGVISEKTKIDARGSISIGSFVYRCWKAGGHGLQNVVSAIANSCDVFFYIVGGGYGGQRGVGVARLADWARRFGLGAKSGLDLSGEAGGLVPDEEWKMRVRGERWYVGNTYHLAIGQGDILLTPLQLNNLVVTIANGGTLYQPLLVREVGQAAGQSGSLAVKEFEPKVIRKNVASERTLQLVRQGMREAAAWGTAYPFRNFSISVAGKTGTAEIGGSQKTHAWFTCFAPFENPEIALTVFLEKGGEGSDTAAPVAREILEKYLE